jgi:hypothetical protein
MSEQYKKEIYSLVCGDDWIGLRELSFKKQVIFFNNSIENNLLNEKGYKVMLAFSEPEAFRVSNQSIIENSNKFDLILTFDEELLKCCKNAVKCLFGTSWIGEEANTINVNNKLFKTSFLCGGKNILEGHRLRQEIWKRQMDIKIHKEFWISSSIPIDSVDNNQLYPTDSSKFLLFKECQFHICIENSRINNYFTEKVCDCFNTYTIPIYWGCPNVTEYFDQDGMILFENCEGLIEKINKLTYKDYIDRIPFVLKNKQKVRDYCGSFSDKIRTIIHNYL